jgi:MFS family permease
MLLLSLFVQDALDLSAVSAGVLLLPAVLGVLVSAPVAGRMFDTDGPRPPTSLSMGITTVALAVIALGVWTETVWIIGVGAAITGVALGFARMLAPQALVSIPEELHGSTSGLIGSLRALGATVGAIAAGAVLVHVTHPTGALSPSDAPALGITILVAAVLTGITGVVASVTLRKRAD